MYNSLVQRVLNVFSVRLYSMMDNIIAIIIIAAAVCVIYGNRGNLACKHANCYDGQYIPEDC